MLASASDPQQLRTHTFVKQSTINTSLERLVGFHNDPKALNKLTPPPIFVQLHRDERTSLIEGELEFTLWFGPLPFRWTAQHEPGPTEHSFADRMLQGPMGYWRHEHLFREVSGGVELTDRVTLGHLPGIRGLFTRLMFDGINLRFLFFYRHWRTRRAVQSDDKNPKH